MTKHKLTVNGEEANLDVFKDPELVAGCSMTVQLDPTDPRYTIMSVRQPAMFRETPRAEAHGLEALRAAIVVQVMNIASMAHQVDEQLAHAVVEAFEDLGYVKPGEIKLSDRPETEVLS